MTRQAVPARPCRKVLTWCPEAEAHAVNLLMLRGGAGAGTLLAAWFHGHEGMSDVSIAVSRLPRSAGAVWAAPTAGPTRYC